MTQDEMIDMFRMSDKDLDVKEIVNFAIRWERESCLKIAESMSLTEANMNKTWRTACRDVAEAIKARGES